jgi:pimeloyl-ACP methyl ester carboxylesterase
MSCIRRLATFALVLACLTAVAACGDNSESANVSPVQDDVLTYRPGVHLDVQQSKKASEGALRTETFEYTSVDGARVPALFAVPTDRTPLGCLVWVPGFAQPKESYADLRVGLAALRLATFTIDARNVGARGSTEQAVEAVKTPEGVRAMLTDTVADLRVGLDWLEQRPECHRNIAVMGTSYGASVATHLAAQDQRIKAAVLTSIGATYKQTILMQPLAAKSVPNLPDYVAHAADDPAILAHAVKVLGPYDLEKWIGKIAPRPVMLINGRFDPIVAPGDALQLAAAVRSPKSILYFDGGHDPFAVGPDHDKVTLKAVQFLLDSMDLPFPTA